MRQIAVPGAFRDRLLVSDTLVMNGGTLGVAGSGAVSVGTTSTSAGTIDIAAGHIVFGYGTVDGPVALSGTLQAQSSFAFHELEVTGGVTGTGTLVVVGQNSTLVLDSGVASTIAVDLSADTGVDLVLATPTAFTATIHDFTSGETIDLSAVAAASAIYDPAATLLHVFAAGGAEVATLKISDDGQYGAGDFAVADGLVSLACFVEGTRIATESGEVAVEALRIGDLVRTVGGVRPVRWMGQRRIVRPEAALCPVRIAAGTFAPGVPSRDLLLSGDHAVACGDALVPVKALVNGITIAPLAVPAVTYWHVELDAHDVVLAEGLAVESYLDTGNRAAFAGAVMDLRPDFSARRSATPCRPIVTEGAEVAAVKRRLLDPLPWTDAPDIALLGPGHVVQPDAWGDWLGFILPGGPVRLASRSAVSAEVRADSSDPRRLGVAVAEILVDGRPVSLDDTRLGAGWHAVEPGWRWTDGEAVLDLGEATHLDIRAVRGAMRYPVQRKALARAG